MGSVVHNNGLQEYHVIITETPGGDYVPCYGVQNRTTGVVESYVNSLGKAIYIAGELEKDLRDGYDRSEPKPQPYYGGPVPRSALS
jgi:hypothetical protein